MTSDLVSVGIHRGLTQRLSQLSALERVGETFYKGCSGCHRTLKALERIFQCLFLKVISGFSFQDPQGEAECEMFDLSLITTARRLSVVESFNAPSHFLCPSDNKVSKEILCEFVL